MASQRAETSSRSRLSNEVLDAVRQKPGGKKEGGGEGGVEEGGGSGNYVLTEARGVT